MVSLPFSRTSKSNAMPNIHGRPRAATTRSTSMSEQPEQGAAALEQQELGPNGGKTVPM